MIIGTGNDLIDIRRVERALQRFGARFEDRIFTAVEQSKARSRSKAGSRTVAATYAKRFAAKEACLKALGTDMNGISWRDMEVVSKTSGAPTLMLSGSALKRLQVLLPKNTSAAIHLALTDEYPFALAHVIIEAIPEIS